MNSSEAPHVLFVFADQMRGMDMGCSGNAQISTPNMDRLAEQGVRFTKAYANCPVCGPSRASLMTGMYPVRNRVVANDLPLPEELPSVGKVFRSHGYATGYIGKWHLDGVPRDKWTSPGDRRHGFDYWAAYNCSHQYYRKAKWFDDNGDPVEREGYEPELQTDLALRFLEKRASDKQPVCLFLSWGPPHDPYHQVPDRFRHMYDPAQLTLRPNVSPVTREQNPLVGRMDPHETLANYYAAITALDEQLGRLMDGLDRLGLADNTILVFASDHGDMLWSQGMMKKQLPYEESISVPLIVRWPRRVPPRSVSDDLIGIVDLAPTLYGLAGLTCPEQVQGRNMASACLGEREAGPDSLLLSEVVSTDEGPKQGVSPWRGVRTSRYTYARKADGTPWLLYDNEQDPYQLINLTDSAAHLEIREMMERRLDQWLAEAEDPSLPQDDMIRLVGRTELWNARERELHPDAPQLIRD